MEPKIICRKCGEEHLTIKCKNYIKIKKNVTIDYNKQESVEINKQESNDQESNDQELNTQESNTQESNTQESNTQESYNQTYNKNGYNKKEFVKKEYKNEPRTNKYKNDKNNKIKISNLPLDIEKDELYELLHDWGNIKNLNIKKNYDNSIAFVEFYTNDQADYFIRALDNTPFEYQIIKVEYCFY